MIVKQKLHKVINKIYEKSVHGYFEQIAKGKQILKKCGKRISQSIHSVHPRPLPPSPFCWGGRVEPPTKFSKRGGLAGSQFLEGGC